MGEFKPEEAVKDATERHERAGGARWVPIATAIVAVLATLANLAAAQRSTQALILKNDTIVAYTRASDTYNYYQAKATKEEIYKAALILNHRPDPALQKVVDREHKGKGPVLAKAREYDKQAAEANEQSERFLRSHEILEVGVTLLEVAVVIFSISTLTATFVLPIAAGIATILGVGFAVTGLLK